jgi:hypothetical protein
VEARLRYALALCAVLAVGAAWADPYPRRASPDTPRGETDMAAYCPRVERAFVWRESYLEKEGRVVLSCATEDGRIRACTVAEEEPRGWGFGNAALEAACRYQLAPGGPQPDAAGRVTIPVRFRSQSEASVP